MTPQQQMEASADKLLQRIEEINAYLRKQRDYWKRRAEKEIMGRRPNENYEN